VAAGRNPEERTIQVNTHELGLRAPLEEAAAAVVVAEATMLMEGPSEWHLRAYANSKLFLQVFGLLPTQPPELEHLATPGCALADNSAHVKDRRLPDLTAIVQSLPFLGSARLLSHVNLSPAERSLARLVL